VAVLSSGIVDGTALPVESLAVPVQPPVMVAAAGSAVRPANGRRSRAASAARASDPVNYFRFFGETSRQRLAGMHQKLA